MGFFDSIKNALGGGEKETETVKGPSAVLREAGIDPSDLDFKFGSDGTVTVSGRVADEATRDRIGELVGAIPQVTGVNNEVEVGAPPVEPEPEPEAPAAPEPPPAEAAAPAEAEESSEPEATDDEAGNTYTVQPGDSLWKIAEAHYGNGTKYQAIFEANRDILDNPDLIHPGQVLKLPEL
jgi:nucleoid-associated protein YgaU